MILLLQGSAMMSGKISVLHRPVKPAGASGGDRGDPGGLVVRLKSAP
jgi:hypothetical protein